MLTNNDVKKFRKIIREEVETEYEVTRNSLDHQIRLSKMYVLQETGELKDRVKDLSIKLNQLQEAIATEEKVL